MSDSSKNLRVVLVEDQDLDREAIKRFVLAEELPYELVMLGSCREALAYLANMPQADVALLDYTLPDGTGLDLLPGFLQASIPVVFITGNGSERVAVEAMRQGAADYLIKDLDRNYLHVMASTIGKVIAHQWMTSERDRLMKELQKAVETLIPICGNCKKIRDDDAYWKDVQKFIAEKAYHFSSYGLCPPCQKEAEESL